MTGRPATGTGAGSPAMVDVCLVVEGCYPFISGGVSSWLDWLIRSQPEISFGVVALTSDLRPRKPAYDSPPNSLFLQVLPLSPVAGKPGLAQPKIDSDRLTDIMCGILDRGDLAAFADLVALSTTPVRRRPAILGGAPAPPSYAEMMGSQAAWRTMLGCYARLCPEASFPDFFWAWRNLVGGLFALLAAPIPPARTYHAISTGYAGLFTARAALQTGCRAAITEHGIYTNERRIDLVMADWINDTVQTGLGGTDDRIDVRDFWIRTFEAYARIAYAGAEQVTTLYGENQTMQRAIGANSSKLRVIPNGIDMTRFQALKAAPPGHRPTAALIGRVVPIKDIEAFVAAAAIIRRDIPGAEVLVIGPTDEDEAYFALCQRRVDELGLQDTVRFTGKVNILDVMPEIDVLVLTSISEAQPLVLLEAGAAGIPCVATDVGSCREILEGAPDELPNLGLGGRIVPVMDSDAIGKAVVELLGDGALRRSCGEALRRRVATRFTSKSASDQYRALYADLIRP